MISRFRRKLSVLFADQTAPTANVAKISHRAAYFYPLDVITATLTFSSRCIAMARIEAY
jgi:hypothetical protein